MSNDNFYSIMCIAVIRKSAATATLVSYGKIGANWNKTDISTLKQGKLKQSIRL